jgi:two-component system, sensor histidine kinase and response regulator
MLIDTAPEAGSLDILVVEDLPASQKLFGLVLSDAGHRVRVACNGLEAIRSFRAQQPDLILMDLQMPILDGLQTSTILRVLQSSAPQVPIIATTACGPAFDRDRFARIGVDDFLPKPIDTRKLVYLVAELGLKKHLMSNDHPAIEGRSLSEPGSLSEIGPQIDIAGTLVRLNGDQKLLTTLVGFFFEDFPGLMDELRDSAARGDAPEVRRTAHSLKGLAANFGAAPAVAALQKVETASVGTVWEDKNRLLKEVEVTVARLAAALVDYHATCQGPRDPEPNR